MRQAWVGLLMGCWAALPGCGGSSVATAGSGGHSANEEPGESAVAGTQANPAAPQPQPGGNSGSSANPPQGTCSKVCVNTASFSFDNPLPADELAAGALKACRNRDQECHTGLLPTRGAGGNSVSFATASVWDGPSVWSPDEWITIEFSWENTQQMSLNDGDSFSLTFVNGNREVLLFEQVVTFEIVHDCAGSCQFARYDLRGVAHGGAPSGGEGGESSGGTGAGSSGEGGTASQ